MPNKHHCDSVLVVVYFLDGSVVGLFSDGKNPKAPVVSQLFLLAPQFEQNMAVCAINPRASIDTAQA